MTDWNAHFNAASNWAGFKVKNPKEFKKIVEYRASYLNDGLITHSFKLENGQQVVCVKADTQGMGQSGATRTLATPPKHVKFADGVHANTFAPSIDGKLDEDGNIRHVPEGSIPRLIPSLKSLCTAKKLSHILRKGHPDIADDVEGVVKKYAFCEQPSEVASVVGGGKATFTVWKPTATFTTSQIWMTANSSPSLQSVEAGWLISAVVNGDSNPHSFIYYTTNNYQNGLSGYNLQSGVFVQTNPLVLIGDTLTPSVYNNGAKQVAMEVQFLYGVDSTSKPVIWFYMGGTAVGYYPLSVFPTPGLGTGATRWLMGGETNSESKTSFPDAMGSGYFAREGLNKAASASNVQYYAYPPGDAINGKLVAYEDTPAKWSITTPVESPTGYSFFYGGPGTQ